MKMNQVRGKARPFRINTFGKTKSDVIRKIQQAEGNFPCFGTAENFCDQGFCCWRRLCFKPS